MGIKKYKHDIFLAYHGGEDDGGSQKEAARIYKILKNKYGDSIDVYFHPISSLNVYHHTPDEVEDSKCFLLVANDKIPVDEKGKIKKDNKNGELSDLWEEVDTFYIEVYKKNPFDCEKLARVIRVGNLDSHKAEKFKKMFCAENYSYDDIIIDFEKSSFYKNWFSKMFPNLSEDVFQHLSEDVFQRIEEVEDKDLILSFEKSELPSDSAIENGIDISEMYIEEGDIYQEFDMVDEAVDCYLKVNDVFYIHVVDKVNNYYSDAPGFKRLKKFEDIFNYVDVGYYFGSVMDVIQKANDKLDDLFNRVYENTSNLEQKMALFLKYAEPINHIVQFLIDIENNPFLRNSGAKEQYLRVVIKIRGCCSTCQYLLGKILEESYNKNKDNDDYEDAIKYYKRAASNNNSKAIKRLEELGIKY